MSESELSASEKRRLLRERRLAKMQQGKASERLNIILSLGNSTGHASVTSILDKNEAKITPPEISEYRTDTPLHDDPEVPEISLLLQQDTDANGSENDMDVMLSKILGTTSGKAGSSSDEEGIQNQFADMMKAMMESQTSEEFSNEDSTSSYLSELTKYYAYEQKRWKARFAFVRLVVHTTNFIHHYLNDPSFKARLNGRLSSLYGERNNFITIFISFEIVIISSYFAVLSRNGLLQAFSRNHILSKMQSMAATFLPQVAKYRPLVDTALVYWGGVSIIIQDLMLLIALWGFTSLIN